MTSTPPIDYSDLPSRLWDREIPIIQSLSPVAIKVICRAYKRESKRICPTPGLWAACQDAVMRSLRTKGLITADGSPVLTPLGERVAVAFLCGADL